MTSVLSSIDQFCASASNGNQSRGPVDDFWFQTIGPASSSGVRVNHDTAMRHATVWACVNAVSETIAALPLPLYRKDRNGDKIPIPDHPLYDVLHDQANSEHTAMEFREIMQSWAMYRGTSFAEIVPGRRGGAVGELLPLHPDETKALKQIDASGRVRWVIEHSPKDAPRRILNRDEVFLLRARAMRRDSIEGVDPITQQAESIGAALATQEYAARFFANDATPHGVLEAPNKFKDNEQRNQFVDQWRARSRTGTAILEQGIKYHQISLTQEQAQYLETRKMQKIDIASIFRVQPHKVAILDDSKFNNIEQQSIEWVTDTLLPWLSRWEQAIRRDLITARDVYAEHNVMGLLRGDIQARYKSYAIGRNWGWLSANDVRRLENMNGIGDDGDHYLQPLNMSDAGDAGNDEQPDRAPQAIGMVKKGDLWIPGNMS